jgi:hypothetical protein
MIHADMAPLRGKAIARAGPAALRCGKTPVQGVPSRTRFPPRPTVHPSSHPVRRRPTHRGAGVVHGVQVERATVRTTWTPWAASARLCLGRRWSGWELPAHATTGPQSGTAPLHPGARPHPNSGAWEAVCLRPAARDARPTPLLRLGPPGRGREHQGRERIPRALRPGDDAAGVRTPDAQQQRASPAGPRSPDGPETAQRVQDSPLLARTSLVGGFFMPGAHQFSGLRHGCTSVADQRSPLGGPRSEELHPGSRDRQADDHEESPGQRHRQHLSTAPRRLRTASGADRRVHPDESDRTADDHGEEAEEAAPGEGMAMRRSAVRPPARLPAAPLTAVPRRPSLVRRSPVVPGRRAPTRRHPRSPDSSSACRSATGVPRAAIARKGSSAVACGRYRTGEAVQKSATITPTT